jgi:hypothetical protein
VTKSQCLSPSACPTRIPVNASSPNRKRSRNRACAAITARSCSTASTCGNRRGRHARTVDRWARLNLLRTIDLGGTVRIPADEAQRLLTTAASRSSA